MHAQAGSENEEIRGGVTCGPHKMHILRARGPMCVSYQLVHYDLISMRKEKSEKGMSLL